MGTVIVIQFITLDGVVDDPDGSGATPDGGWAFRRGPEATAGDKFRLGEVLDAGALLLGRVTWQLFSRLFPRRDDPFSLKMNAMPKLVLSRTLDRVDGWANSSLLRGDVVAEVARRRPVQDVVVAGSLGVVQTLREHDLVDQYRLLVFPTVLGGGRRLFDGRGKAIDLDLVSTEEAGCDAVRQVYNRRRTP